MSIALRTISIVAIAVASYVVGGATVFLVTGGPKVILALPFLMVFGWFYLIPIIAIVSLMWFAAGAERRSWWFRVSFVAVCMLLWAVLARTFGIKGPEPYWQLAYATAGSLAGMLAAVLTLATKGHILAMSLRAPVALGAGDGPTAPSDR